MFPSILTKIHWAVNLLTIFKNKIKIKTKSLKDPGKFARLIHTKNLYCKQDGPAVKLFSTREWLFVGRWAAYGQPVLVLVLVQLSWRHLDLDY